MRKVLILTGLTILLLSCGRRERTVVMNNFFNVPEFITKQVVEIKNHKGAKLLKTVSVDGVSDTRPIALDTFSLSDELAVFKEFDINKPAYKNVFEIDTVGSTIKYNNTKDSHIPIKTLEYNSTTNYLKINGYKKNLLTEIFTELTFKASTAIEYSIVFDERTKVGDNSITTISGKITY